MNRRNFLSSMFLAGGAAIAGAALLPKVAKAAPLLDQLKDMDKGLNLAAPEAGLPAPGAEEVQFRRRREFRRERRRRCVTRVNRRGRLVRICSFN